MSDSDLQQLISERIQRDGPITFAEYMRMALYEPEYGYYMTSAAKMGAATGRLFQHGTARKHKKPGKTGLFARVCGFLQNRTK